MNSDLFSKNRYLDFSQINFRYNLRNILDTIVICSIMKLK